MHPKQVWSGVMTNEFAEYPTAKVPIELEIFERGSGILRTQSGWFAVSGFSASPVFTFDVDMNRELAPGPLDETIVKRAAHMLSSTAVWNRADNRKCPADAKSWSIYCAMEKATRDVTGGFHHRRPALEVVRVIIDKRTANRPYDHRLMDYNNDKTTTLAEVHSLFREALADMNNSAWLAANGFAPRPKN